MVGSSCCEAYGTGMLPSIAWASVVCGGKLQRLGVCMIHKVTCVPLETSTQHPASRGELLAM
jgi:hypothetical protein